MSDYEVDEKELLRSNNPALARILSEAAMTTPRTRVKGKQQRPEFPVAPEAVLKQEAPKEDKPIAPSTSHLSLEDMEALGAKAESSTMSPSVWKGLDANLKAKAKAKGEGKGKYQQKVKPRVARPTRSSPS